MNEEKEPQTLTSTFLYSLVTSFSLFVLGYWLMPIFRKVFDIILPFIPTNVSKFSNETNASAKAIEFQSIFFPILKMLIIIFIFIAAAYWIIWALKKNINEAYM